MQRLDGVVWKKGLERVFSRRRCGGYRLQAIAKAVRAACADSRLERRGLGQRPSNMGKALLASPRKTSCTEATPAAVEKSLSPARIAACRLAISGQDKLMEFGREKTRSKPLFPTPPFFHFERNSCRYRQKWLYLCEIRERIADKYAS